MYKEIYKDIQKIKLVLGKSSVNELFNYTIC